MMKVKEGNLTYLWVIGELLKLCVTHAKATWTGVEVVESKAPLLPEHRSPAYLA